MLFLNDGLLSIVDDHATKVATIICGEELGLAPDCQVYATYATNAVEFIEQMEWLITQGVHVINVSMGVPYGRFGTYTLIDKWSDHIDMNHNVLVVSATGNLFPNFKQVCSPAMSFNGIAVGAYDDADTATHMDDTLWSNSAYIELEVIPEEDEEGEEEGEEEGNEENDEIYEFNGTGCLLHAEKPDLIAPGANIMIPGLKLESGTSFAAPFVTGTVAQMISANLNLKSQPAILKAALLASAFRKIDATNYGTVEGDAPYLSDKEGAGKLDSKNAIYVIASNNYTYEYFWSTTNEYTFTLHVSSAETQMRVALTWLKQCVFNASDLESASIGHGDWASVNVLEN